jgi:glutamate 5-kinase
METKLIAAELATAAGCATVITLGSVPSRILTIVQAHAPATPRSASPPNLSDPTPTPTPPPHDDDDDDDDSIVDGPGVEFALGDESLPPHTLFTPKPRPLSSRRFWILHGLTPRGTIYIDEGAYRAISRSERNGGGGGNGGRLLAAGVLRVEGTFAAGQAVRVCVIRGRWGSKKGGERVVAGARDVSRPVSPDHFADRKRRTTKEDELVNSVKALEVVEEKDDLEDVLEFGRGLTNYNSLEIDRVKGLRRCACFLSCCSLLFDLWLMFLAP